jgi:hypothetical protein
VVLLDERYLLATRSWPWLARALHARMSEHARRDRAQLAISHLPRVEDRLMALMWLLADGWGRVTPTGIRIGLSLSHEVLGGLIGAQRPTVTLAVGELAKRNVLIRQDEQWLIVEPPVSPEAIGDLPHVGVGSRRFSPWGATEREGASAGPDRPGADLQELRALSAQRKDRARRLRERSAVLHAQSAALAAEIVATRCSARERSGEDTLGPMPILR